MCFVFIRFEKPLENIRREEMFVRNHRHVGEWRQGAEVSPKERAIEKEKYNKDSDHGLKAPRDSQADIGNSHLPIGRSPGLGQPIQIYGSLIKSYIRNL